MKHKKIVSSVKPSISIITAVRNNAGTIAHCIESVRSQSLAAEHIIIDGCSTDGTLGVIDSYRPSLALVVSEPDRGIYDAMNKGIRAATGDVIGILNSDDFYASGHVIETVVEIMSDERIDSCYGDLVYVRPDDTGKITRKWKSVSFLGRSFYWGWMPPHPTFFVRRSIYEKYGMFNLTLGSAADYELMLRFLVKHKITTAYIPEVLVRMRVGGRSNASLNNRLKANRMDRKAWEVNGLKPFPWTTSMKPLRKLGQFLVFA
jgi:glycosyltransferase